MPNSKMAHKHKHKTLFNNSLQNDSFQRNVQLTGREDPAIIADMRKKIHVKPFTAGISNPFMNYV